MIDTVSLARLSILPSALALIGVVIWYMRALQVLPRSSPKRVAALLVFVIGGLLLVISQKSIYYSIAVGEPMKDVVVQLVMAVEAISGIGIIFYYLRKGQHRKDPA